MNFEEVYKNYLIYAQKRHKKQGFITILNDFNLHILPYFKDKDIYCITKLDIIEWQNKIYDLKFKNSTLNKLYSHFNSFMQYCCDYYNLEHNYVKEVGNFHFSYEVKKFDFYNLKEFNLFISAIDNIIYKNFFTFLFYTGVRCGECLALRSSDLENDYVFIRHTLTSKGGRCIDTPKNVSSIRKIRLDKYLLKDLNKLRQYYVKFYNCDSYDYFIFGGKKYLSPTTINRYKKNACDKVGLRCITLHQFRHSHATLLLNNGIVINEVSRRLGHSKVSTTLDIYTHTDLTQEKRVINTLSSMRFDFKTILNDFKNFISISKLKK